MNAIIDWSLSRSRAVLACLAVLMAAGIYAYAKIPKESDPDVHIPLIYVNLALEGIQPEDAERLLLRPAEIELKSVEGIKEMRSNAFEGGAYVVLEFDAGFDAKKALDDVREKVDRVKPKLPAEAEEPRVTEINLSLLPVLVVTLSGDVPERSLVRLARALKDSIESLPAVLEAKLVGNREESVEIIIDPLAAESYGLSADDVATLLTR
ncbi:MAG: efflux RND transporter permease subunit, partial [Alphaproteobacteria bacterium]|nr:efflux RND transporter permease subunit [Alphaproteobacteria bacterium]